MCCVTNVGTSFTEAMLLRARGRRLLYGSQRASPNGRAAFTHGSTSKCWFSGVLTCHFGLKSRYFVLSCFRNFYEFEFVCHCCFAIEHFDV